MCAMERRPHGSAALKRGAAIAVRIVTVILVIASCALVGVYAWLTTARGERWLKAELLRSINADIRGHVSIERLRIHDLALDLDGIVLRAPSGEAVARSRALTRIELLPLSFHKVALHGARASGVVL